MKKSKEKKQGTKKLKKEKTNSTMFILLKTLSMTALFLILMIVFSAGVIVAFGFFQLTQFTSAAQLNSRDLVQLVETGFTEEIIETNGKKNILILGVDQVENRTGDPLLTDTIMLVSMDTQTLETNLLSLPRDLWLEEYQTKINALYYYGADRYPEQPQLFATEVIMGVTGVPIHHTLVLTLDQVGGVIDAVGGIEVNVTTGFTDNRFPRSDVDIRTETDPAILYETITFEAGVQKMNGETALKYIRSRHSGDEQGTDDARAERQQQVIAAIVDTVFARSTITNSKKVGSLFRTYQDTFGKDLPLTQLLAVAKRVAEYDFDLAILINKQSLSITDDQQVGVLEHPPVSETQNQWVYVIVDQAAFKKEVWQKLDLINN